MLKRAVILGGTGAIGYAVARRLLGSGWEVALTGRDAAHVPRELLLAGASFRSVDRDDSTAMATLLEPGADLLVDCACFTAAQASALVPLLSAIDSTVMISSKAVYVDADGRHVNSDDPPAFACPVREDQPTLRPNEANFNSPEGYGPNKVAAEQVLLESGQPVTVLRASKVHGAWSRLPREWVFVKRVLDRRRVVLLAGRGRGVDHPSAAANIASLVEVAAAWREILLDGDGSDGLGRTPWDAVPPIVLDTSAAAALGYRPAGSYAQTVASEIDWLVAATRDPAMRWGVPADEDRYFGTLFDYSAEDRFVAGQATANAGTFPDTAST